MIFMGIEKPLYKGGWCFLFFLFLEEIKVITYLDVANVYLLKINGHKFLVPVQYSCQV